MRCIYPNQKSDSECRDRRYSVLAYLGPLGLDIAVVYVCIYIYRHVYIHMYRVFGLIAQGAMEGVLDKQPTKVPYAA